MTFEAMMKKPTDNESLWRRLRDAEVLDAFCDLLFGQRKKQAELLEQLEQWGISSSGPAISRFSDRYCSEWTFSRARRMAGEIAAGPELDEIQRRIVAEKVFNLAARPDIDDATLLRLRDQEIKLATVRQNDERLKQNEVRLGQAQETIDLQKRKIEALEAQAEAAMKAAERAKEAVKGGSMDDKTREALLAEVDAIMLGKPKPQREVV
jgi:hypothetical protein